MFAARSCRSLPLTLDTRRSKMASSTDSTDALPEDSAPDNETPQAGSTAEGQVEAASTATPPLPDDGSRPAHNVAGSSPHAYQFNNPGGALAYLEAALAKETDTRPPLVYMTDCPSLPATRPPGFPHIIDLHRDRFHTDETNCADLTCADGIATFLWKWDKEQFHRFFDLLAVPEFEIHYEVPGEVQYRTNDTVISRTNRTVTVSAISFLFLQASLEFSVANMCSRSAGAWVMDEDLIKRSSLKSKWTRVGSLCSPGQARTVRESSRLQSMSMVVGKNLRSACWGENYSCWRRRE